MGNDIINFGTPGPPGITNLGGADLPVTVGATGQILVRVAGVGPQGLPATAWATPASGGGGGFTAAGDLSGTSSTQTVVSATGTATAGTVSGVFPIYASVRLLASGQGCEVDEGVWSATSAAGATTALLTYAMVTNTSYRIDISVIARDTATNNSWQCDYQCRYDMGASGSPTASKALAPVNFTAPSGTLATLPATGAGAALTVTAGSGGLSWSVAGLAGVANVKFAVTFSISRI